MLAYDLLGREVKKITIITLSVTSNTKNCVQQGDISVMNNTFSATLDASSITTFVSQ
jgi:O-glycosyl hydrolase